MKLASRKSLALVLLLSAAAAQGADPAPKESSDALETARRDLRELPAIERGLPPVEPRPESTVQLPLFTPAPPSKAQSSTFKSGEDDFSKTAPSQGWLLDALKKTEAQDRGRGRSLLGDDRLSAEAARRKSESAPNPLNNYLQQWLSPGDRSLLGGDKLNPTQLERAGIRDDEPFRPKTTYDTKPLLSNARPHLPMSGDHVNPYLTPAPSEDSLLPESLAPLPATSTSRAPLSRLSNPATDQTTYSPQWDTAPTLNGPTKQEPLPPPTAPLLDERRYFPQLRRF